MKANTLIVKAILPLVIVAVGFIAMKKMQAARVMPEKVMRKERGALVEVMEIQARDKSVRIHSTGTVTSREEVVITPQVSGQVVKVHPRFQNGGFFTKGDILFEIEEIDYVLAKENAKAALARAEFELANIEGKAKVARMEWERLNQDRSKDPGDLLLYKPQLNNAQAAYDAAKAGLDMAQLNLDRTRIRAPFNCIVRSEQVDVGQFVRSGNPVATVAGTDVVEIIVPVRLDDLDWLIIPNTEATGTGSEAVISIELDGKRLERHGRLVRKLADVDPKGRMARVVVEVDDPFNLKKSRTSGFELSLGLFVNVGFTGQELKNVVVVPRSVVRDHNTVWLLGDEDKLRVQKIEILRQDRQEAIVSAGLVPGDIVVRTNLTGAANGMKLRQPERRQN